MDSCGINLYCSVVLIFALLGASFSTCPQLGCDFAGRFTQDEFKFTMLDENRSIAWKSEIFSTEGLNPENLNFGCVSNDKFIACIKSEGGMSRHAFFNATTGAEIIVDCDQIMNAGMPIVVEKFGGGILAVNATHVGIVYPSRSYCDITAHGHQLMFNALSPVYVAAADAYIIAGNNSDVIMMWMLDKFGSPFKVLDYKIANNQSKTKCPWMPMLELAVSGSRLYIYGIGITDDSGFGDSAFIALDITGVQPFIKVAWLITDEMSEVSTFSRSTPARLTNCTYVPDVDPDYAWFPPSDLALQMLATPDGYITITSEIGLITLKDHGDSGEQVFESMWGDHYMTYVRSKTGSNSSSVWMAGWQLYPPFRAVLSSFNYTPPYVDDRTFKGLSFLDSLKATDMNTTSRLMTFNHPTLNNSKIIVLAVRYNTTTDSTQVVMATNAPFIADVKAKPLWMLPLPNDLETGEVKGQIIGVQDKLVLYVSDGMKGYVMAIK